MNARTIAYWTTTVLFSLAIGAAGAADVALTADMVAAMEHLGYPQYFAQILGVWKILGAVALLVPAFPRLKEWAYAGFFFNLTGAALSHLAVGDGAGGAVAPLVLLTLAAVSWATAPASRQVGTRVALPSGAPEPQLAK